MIKTAKHVRIWISTFAIAGAAWIADASATVPTSLTQQARLLDANGNAVDATINFVFSIYNVPSAGTAVWTETQTITVDQGFFSARLGEKTAFTAGLFDGSKPLYLGIKVGDDEEMTPRQLITSVPFALRAGEADQARAASGDLKTTLDALASRVSPDLKMFRPNHGNNGTVSCDEFCSNKETGWGSSSGTCAAAQLRIATTSIAKYAAKFVSCSTVPNTMFAGSWSPGSDLIQCYCFGAAD